MTRAIKIALIAACLIACCSRGTMAAARLLFAESDTLQLPFFDDFSSDGTLPSSQLWDNSGASVSRYLPQRPPSLGALVLDAIGPDGNFYPSAAYGAQSHADTVTSKPINLYYPGNKTVYLSFYYQAGGFADRPEPQDSLCLDFYSPDSDEWQTVRIISSAPQKSFAQEIVQISDRKYLQGGFRFRFRNYISLGSSLQPDLVSNCDFWLIDYVRLDKNRSVTDTVYSDVSIASPPEFKLGDYQLVPWTHYKSAPERLKPSYTIFYRNNDDKARLLDSLSLSIHHGTDTSSYELGAYNMPLYMDFTNTNTDFGHVFYSDSDTAASFDITVRLVSDATSLDFPGNNSVTISKRFADCYAYDDGSAEAAYGIHGEGSLGAQAAIKFVTIKPDLLNGVYMYFCPVYQDRQADYFNLKVWTCSNGVPDIVVYSKNNIQVPKSEAGKFTFIDFDESIQVSDTFFVGWEKLSTSIIALGFDKNTAVPNNKYFNLGGTWTKSSEKGQVMIRPSFGALSTPAGDLSDDIAENISRAVRIYPNPASSYITLETDFDMDGHLFHLYDIAGRRVLTMAPSGSLHEQDISMLKPGLYIMLSDTLHLRAKIMVVR